MHIVGIDMDALFLTTFEFLRTVQMQIMQFCRNRYQPILKSKQYNEHNRFKYRHLWHAIFFRFWLLCEDDSHIT